MFSWKRYLALLMLVPFMANSQVLCFASEPNPKIIRLQIRLPREGSITAFVKYERGAADIPVLRLKETAISPPGQLPATVETTFAELIEGKRAGQYVLTTQGGAVGDLVYSRTKDAKAIVFYEDHQATRDDTCYWNQEKDADIQSK